MKPIDGSTLMAMRKTIIAQNEALQKAVAAKPDVEKIDRNEFGDTMASALAKVNDLQNGAGDITQEYTMGKTNDIAAVMLAKQKASVGFEATLQVRNKLLSAYKDIMNMPV